MTLETPCADDYQENQTRGRRTGFATLPALKKQGAIRELTGKLAWQGDLDAMRTDVLPVTGADLDEIFAHEDSDS